MADPDRILTCQEWITTGTLRYQEKLYWYYSEVEKYTKDWSSAPEARKPTICPQPPRQYFTDDDGSVRRGVPQRPHRQFQRRYTIEEVNTLVDKGTLLIIPYLYITEVWTHLTGNITIGEETKDVREF